MANVTYYPAQKLSVVTGNNLSKEIQLVQSADVDFSISRQDIYEFGNLFAVDNIQVEPSSATLNFSYIVGTGINNHTSLGLNNLSSLLTDVTGRNYTLQGAGLLNIPSGSITSYSVEGSVGNVPTVSVSVQALDASYTTGVAYPTYPGGDETAINVVRPDQIHIYFDGAEYECRSFTYTLDIGREYINKLGQLTPIATIVTTPPKVTVDAELILRHADNGNPKFGNSEEVDVSIRCGNNIDFGVSGAKISNFTTNTSLDDIQVASITLERPIRNNSDITISA
jgi:hypothetical protein